MQNMDTLLDMARRPKNLQPLPLRELRENRYWSIATLSRLASVDPVTIWRIENHHTSATHNSTARRIADALGVHPDAVSEFVRRPGAAISPSRDLIVSAGDDGAGRREI
jgi:transcriptional regulator with XRE-family HTH domain